MSQDLRVDRNLTIPAAELELRFTPSGGPGGQHANRSSTRAELTWKVRDSEVLTKRQRELLLGRLRHRIDSKGALRLTSDAHRSQMRNRGDVQRRLADLVADALRPPKTRRPTAPTKAARERRLQDKKRRSEIKKLRKI